MRFWNYVNACKSDNSSIDCLIANGDKITHPEVMADSLNAQFSPLLIKKMLALRDPFVIPIPVPTQWRILVVLIIVCKLLQGINVSENQDPDNISPRIQKVGAD